MEIQFRSVLQHILQQILTLRPVGYSGISKVTLEKPHFWPKITGFFIKIAVKSPKIRKLSKKMLILKLPDLVVSKNGQIFEF